MTHGEHYRDVQQQPTVLTPEDEAKLAAVLDRCPGCGGDETKHWPGCPTLEAHTIDVGYVHTGQWGWKNDAEFEWVCDETCPHPDHDEEGT